MIIPIKCFTCGEVIADKYRYYQDINNVIYLTQDNIKKTPEGEVFDKLKLKYCCRKHLLTHVDLD